MFSESPFVLLRGSRVLQNSSRARRAKGRQMRGEFGGKEGNLQASCRVATVYEGFMLINKINRFFRSQPVGGDRYTEQRGPPKKFLP